MTPDEIAFDDTTTPQALAAEREVLGILIKWNCRDLPIVARQTQDGAAFHDRRHRRIWRELKRWFDEEVEFEDDAVFVERAFLIWALDEPSKMGDACLADDLGGGDYVMQVASSGISRTLLATHLRPVVNCYKLRQLRAGLRSSYQSAGLMPDATDVIDEVVSLAESVSTLDRPDRSDPRTVGAKAQANYLERWEGTIDHGLRTGMATDSIFRIAPSTMTVVAGYSKHGKTSLALNLAGKLAREQAAIVLYYPCEGYQQLLVTRFLCATWADDESFVVQHPTTGKAIPTLQEHWHMDPARWLERAPGAVRAKARQDFEFVLEWYTEHSAVYIKQVGPIDARDVESDLVLMRARHPDRRIVCVVDYLQHCHVGDDKMRPLERIAEASRKLSGAAGKTGAAMIALSQYTDPDAAAKPPLAVPNHAQVRNAKDIRNDAAAIVTVHRPWFNGDRDALTVIDVLPREGRASHGVMHFEGATKQYRWWDSSHDGTIPAIPGLHSRRVVPPCQRGGFSPV